MMQVVWTGLSWITDSMKVASFEKAQCCWQKHALFLYEENNSVKNKMYLGYQL